MFSVISIRPHKDRGQGWKYEYRPDGFFATGITLQYLVEEAYGIYETDRLIGLPRWAGAATYDIQAKVDETTAHPTQPLTPDQQKNMLRALLKERFGFEAHPETRDLPAFSLVIAKNGRRTPECKPGQTRASGMTGTGSLVTRSQPGLLTVECADMKNFSQLLTAQVERHVEDGTGLSAKYNFDLHWDTADARNAGSEPTPSEPSFLTALQEQLGLRLKPIKVPLSALVIDRVQSPTEN